MIREGSQDPDVRMQRNIIDLAAQQGFQRADVNPWSPSAAYMDQVFKFAKSYHFARDAEVVAEEYPEIDNPRKTEYLRGARFIIEYRGMKLDCDDYSILIGSLARAADLPVRLVILAADPDKPKKFTHVYPEVRIREKWIAMDAVMDRPGESYPNWTRRTFIKV